MKTIKKFNIRKSIVKLNEPIDGNKVFFQKIDSPDPVVSIFNSLIGDETQEVFVVLLLNSQNKVIGYTEIARGSVSQCAVDMRELFKAAIMLSADSIIISHNHPSENLEPSGEDIELTNRIVKIGKLIGVCVLDHIIVSTNGYTSFRERGMISEEYDYDD